MVIKKQWYDIIAPEMFDEKKIGETLSTDPKYLVERAISVSLADLTGDYSKFYIKLLFKIDRVDEKAHTRFIGHECMHERIYRMIHRYMRRVDCIQNVVTKDNRNVRIKLIFILLKRVNTSIKNSARNAAERLLEKTAREKTLEDFVKMMLTDELQNTIKKQISKIYPISNIEIRKSELLEEAATEIGKEVKRVEKEEPEAKIKEPEAKAESKKGKAKKPEVKAKSKKEVKKAEKESGTKKSGIRESKEEKQPDAEKKIEIK